MVFAASLAEQASIARGLEGHAVTAESPRRAFSRKLWDKAVHSRYAVRMHTLLWCTNQTWFVVGMLFYDYGNLVLGSLIS